MRRHYLAAACAIASASILVSGRAQAQGAFPVVLTLPGSTAALSMGGAYPISSAAPDVVFYNPALVRNARGMMLSHERFGSESSLTSFAATSTTNITVGVQVLDYGAGNGIQIGDRLLALSLPADSHAGEVAGTAAYARTVHGVRLGVAGKWIQQWRDGIGTGGAAFDVGATANPLGFLAVGLVAQNLGASGDNAKLDLPRRFQLQLATDSHELGPLDIMASGEVHDVRGGKIGGGIGTEISYWPFSRLTFFARGGLRMGTTSLRVIVPDRSLTIVKQNPPTAGAGVSYKRMTFSYAWDSLAGAADAHRFQVDIN